jgi:hypothetical protein
MRLSAFECLARGAKILRGNGRLVLWRWLFMLVPALFGVLALALPLLVAGIDSLSALPSDPLQLQTWARQLGERWMAADSQTLLLSSAGSAVLLLLAVIAWAFVEAGTYGILYGADRQAPPGAPAGPWFRTLSLREFFGWAGRYVWRYVRLVLLWCPLVIVVSATIGYLVAMAGTGATRWGAAAGFAIGCGGALPLGFLLFGLIAGVWLAMADLVREESGAWRGLTTGLRVFGRRLGAVLLLLVAWLLGFVAIAFTFEISSRWVHAAIGTTTTLSTSLDLGLALIESLATGAIQLWLAASMVVLVRGETRARRASEASDATQPALAAGGAAP